MLKNEKEIAMKNSLEISKRKIRVMKIKTERGIITINLTEIKVIRRKLYKQPFANKLNSLDGMDK